MDISGVGDLKQQIARVDPSKGQPALTAKAEASQVKPSQEQPSQEQLADSVIKMNDFVQNIERNLSFFVDEATGHDVVKVVDRSTDELIRQFPTEDFLKMSENLSDVAGLLFEDQV